MKIAINRCYGGFSLSRKCAEFLAQKGCQEAIEYLSSKNIELYPFRTSLKRNDPLLIEAIETLGTENSSGNYASIEIIEIPDDIGSNWHIEEYDGMEHVAENHRTW